MKAAVAAAVLVLGVCWFGWSSTRGAVEPPKPPPEQPRVGPIVDYAPAVPAVTVPDDADDKLKAVAQDLATFIGVKNVSSAKSNPVACVWVEINHWKPTPGKAGYYVIHQPGGTLVSASDFEQLKLAIEKFKASVQHTKEGGPQFPVGLMSNYPVVAAGG